MSEPRKPLFGFLWPSPDPGAPVDRAYRQVRMVRVANRGPIRVVVLATASVLTVAVIGTALMAALAGGLGVATLVGGAVAASLLVLVLRGWVVGTFVTDQGLTVVRTWRSTAVPWSDVSAITVVSTRVPFLGLPLRVRGERCVVRCADAVDIATHLYTSSPDLWLRPEAWDMARLRLLHWFERA